MQLHWCLKPTIILADMIRPVCLPFRFMFDGFRYQEVDVTGWSQSATSLRSKWWGGALTKTSIWVYYSFYSSLFVYCFFFCVFDLLNLRIREVFFGDFLREMYFNEGLHPWLTRNQICHHHLPNTQTLKYTTLSSIITTIKNNTQTLQNALPSIITIATKHIRIPPS